MDLVIEGSRIAAVHPHLGASQVARRTEDLSGTYVVPGFMDMHAHPMDSADPEGSLELMLANGITGVRQMSGSPELLQRRREGRLVVIPDAPAILAMPGTILTRANAATPAQAVAEVDRQHQAGADFIKEVDVSRLVFLPVAAEAKRLQLPFAGHLSPTVDVREAARAGMHSIEHLGPRDSILLGCSVAEAALRPPAPPPSALPPAAAASPAAERVDAPPQVVPPDVKSAFADPILATPPAELHRYDLVLGSFSGPKCDELASELRADQVWQVPTLIRLQTMELADDPAHLSGTDMIYAPPASRRLWMAAVAQYRRQITPDQHRTLERLFQAQLDLVKRFRDDGVPMLAGSDFGGGLEAAGFSLHEEFDLLVRAGLTPLQVLQATTVNAARFLQATDRLGAVGAGREADLVVLEGDPTQSAANLHRIRAVVRAGRYYSRRDLDGLLARVRERYGAARSASAAPPPRR